MNTAEKQKFNTKNLIFAIIAVVFCVASGVFIFFLNITPSVALEQKLRCNIEEHIHTDQCYNGDFCICTKPAHSHDGNCYIVLLNENDINDILTMLGNDESHSLEGVINNVVSSALNFNENINSPSNQHHLALTQKDVEAMNNTISKDSQLPDITLNENINTMESIVDSSNKDILDSIDIEQTPQTNNYKANFYIYLDKSWTCIGTLDFTTATNGNRYNSVVNTNDLLNLLNSTLGTNYKYSDIDVASSTSQNGSYSTSNLSVGSSTTIIAYRQNSTNSRTARHVRIIQPNASASSTAFAFYTVNFVYPDGSISEKVARAGTSITLPEGNYEWSDGTSTYAAGQTVTISNTKTFSAKTLGPITFVNINYNVNFPTVSGVTVATKPTIAGISTATTTDGFSEGASAVIRNVSQQSVQGSVNGNSTGLSRVVQFKGWKVGSTDTVLQPNTHLVWEELLKYADGSTINLTAVWEYSALQTASFFIRFDSVAVDTNGNITSQDSNKYTKELFAAYVGGIDTSLSSAQLQSLYHIADTTSDNSYGADQKIRALYGENPNGVWLSAFPNDEYIFQSLVQYANTGYLSVDGVAVKAEDLNDREYAIRWYVFKSQDDAWHIDGKLVKKEGLIHIYKTFAGNKALIAEAKEDFYIDAYNSNDNTHTYLYLNDYTTYDSATDTYMWEIENVDYGELWNITEYPHMFDDPSVNFSVYSEYTVMDALGSQSVTGTGTSLTISGMTYALDEGLDEVLRAEFTNIYNRSDSIIIKKQDALTGVSIGGATFKLLQNGKTLTFTYDSETDSYKYDSESGTETVLNGSANGYFEISIEDFSYEMGNIVIREISAPDGYTPIGDIEIGYMDDDKNIGIIGGNSQMIKYINGILIVGNSTESSSVTVQKSWDCPESEWQDVKIQLLANGKLVTTVISGVIPEIVLNNDNNWSYTWENLPVYVNGAKIQWSVRETQIGSEACKADGSFINWLVSYELPVYSIDEDGNENTRLVITNTTKRVMLRLTKTDLSKSVQLKGAEFILDAVDKNGIILPSEISKRATTGDAGTLIFDNLKCGIRYRLTELQAPDGYLKTDEYIYFTINEDGSVAVENSYFAEAGNTAYNITVRNAPAIALPESGGEGDSMFYAFGLLLVVLATGIYINTFRKRRCGN